MKRYCDSLTTFSRRSTSEVPIGSVVIGGGNPVRVQSMTNTDTNDTEASVAQAERIAAAGGEIVRLTAQGRREARNLALIHSKLRTRGCSTPLVADIHFLPEAALIAARNVEKVRINPGNFNDKGGTFSELLDICRNNGTALRIGVNHGSLAPHMMERYGDTPEGMVASAMEFLRRCRDADFHNVVVSMKSSNVRVMVHAYRMLTAAMAEEGMKYPLHLGVTEAGNDMEGRIKSSVGIGALLADGLGDTIRVSLTEAPENEIPVARKLTACFEGRQNHGPIPAVNEGLYSPFEYRRRQSYEVAGVGGFSAPGRTDNPDKANSSGTPTAPGNPDGADGAGNPLKASAHDTSDIPGNPSGASAHDTSDTLDDPGISDIPGNPSNSVGARKVIIGSEITDDIRTSFYEAEATGEVDNIPAGSIVILSTANVNAPAAMRSFFLRMEEAGKHNPVIIKRTYAETDLETLQVRAAADTGMLLLDGYGDGLWIEHRNADRTGIEAKAETKIEIETKTETKAEIEAEEPNQTAVPITDADIDALSLAILQAARVRTSRPEYIACPGCGRTLYDLEKTLKDIKERTSDMVGVKIGVMGCIVNGPGEMADADYGYVGSGPGKITLYKGREVVKRNIPQEDAIDELIKLINPDKR